MDLQTMTEGARLFRLKDVSVTNEQLATAMNLRRYKNDEHGQPGCCFSGDYPNVVVAIRLSDQLVAVMNLFEIVSDRLVTSGLATPTHWTQVLYVPRKR